MVYLGRTIPSIHSQTRKRVMERLRSCASERYRGYEKGEQSLKSRCSCSDTLCCMKEEHWHTLTLPNSRPSSVSLGSGTLSSSRTLVAASPFSVVVRTNDTGCPARGSTPPNSFLWLKRLLSLYKHADSTRVAGIDVLVTSLARSDKGEAFVCVVLLDYVSRSISRAATGSTCH